MKRFILFSISLVLVMTSCQKDPQTILPTPDDYLPMKVGNQWVYESYAINSTTGAQVNSYICTQESTTTIIGKSIINGKQYYEFETVGDGSVCGTQFLRNDNGVILDEAGVIHFSPDDFTNILHTHADPTIASIATPMEYQMFDPNAPIGVPAGTFTSLEYRGTLELLSSGEARNCSDYYAKDIGVVKRTFATMTGTLTYHKDLVSYTLL